MSKPFSKEMGTYLEVRNQGKKHHLSYVGFKRRISLAYHKSVQWTVSRIQWCWGLVFPKPRIEHSVDDKQVIVFDRERSPLVDFVKKKFAKQEVEQEEIPEEDIDIALVQQTIKDHKV